MPKKPAGLKLAYVAPMFAVILLGIFGYLYYFGENHAPYRNLKTYLGQAFERYSGSNMETSSQKPGEITIQQSNIAGAQVQALDLKTQNTSTENQLVQRKAPNDELRAAREELKAAKERVGELEREVSMIDTMLSQSQQKIAKLTKELNQEKQNGKLLSSEIEELKGAKKRIADLEGAVALGGKVSQSNKRLPTWPLRLIKKKRAGTSSDPSSQQRRI